MSEVVTPPVPESLPVSVERYDPAVTIFASGFHGLLAKGIRIQLMQLN